MGPFTEIPASELMGWNMKCESFNDHKNKKIKSFESSLLCCLQKFYTAQFQGSRSLGKASQIIFPGRGSEECAPTSPQIQWLLADIQCPMKSCASWPAKV